MPSVTTKYQTLSCRTLSLFELWLKLSLDAEQCREWLEGMVSSAGGPILQCCLARAPSSRLSSLIFRAECSSSLKWSSVVDAPLLLFILFERFTKIGLLFFGELYELQENQSICRYSKSTVHNKEVKPEIGCLGTENWWISDSLH